MLTIETISDPTQLPLYQIKDKCVVVIDILRATSTIATALDNGAEKVIPVRTKEEAISYKENNPSYIVAGERDGSPIPGLDKGNSPFEYLGSDINQKTVVITTTNGTKCIELSKNASAIVIGSFLNLTATIDLIRKRNEDVVLFCAGWKDMFNLEDFLFAGAVVDSLATDYETKDDSSLAAQKLYSAYQGELSNLLQHASHPKRFEKLGVTKDLDYCLKIDEHPVALVVQDGAITVV